MSHRRRSHAARLILWLVAGALVCAAESATPQETGISAAQRDYHELKAATSRAAGQENLPLPKLTQPSLDLRADLPPPSAPGLNMSRRNKAAKPDPESAKSKNWLVDAMLAKKPDAGLERKPNDTRDAGRADDELTSTSAGDILAMSERGTADQRANSAHADRENERPSAANNPLQSFMAAWMTSKDFELLKLGGEGAGRGDAGLPSLAGPPHAEASAALPMASETNRWRSEPPPAQPNPYLSLAGESLLSGGSPAAPSGSLAAQPAERPRAPSLPVTPVDTPGSREKTVTPAEEFKRSQTEAKYFPQLKRF